MSCSLSNNATYKAKDSEPPWGKPVREAQRPGEGEGKEKNTNHTQKPKPSGATKHTPSCLLMQCGI